MLKFAQTILLPTLYVALISINSYQIETTLASSDKTNHHKRPWPESSLMTPQQQSSDRSSSHTSNDRHFLASQLVHPVGLDATSLLNQLKQSRDDSINNEKKRERDDKVWKYDPALEDGAVVATSTGWDQPQASQGIAVNTRNTENIKPALKPAQTDEASSSTKKKIKKKVSFALPTETQTNSVSGHGTQQVNAPFQGNNLAGYYLPLPLTQAGVPIYHTNYQQTQAGVPVHHTGYQQTQFMPNFNSYQPFPSNYYGCTGPQCQHQMYQYYYNPNSKCIYPQCTTQAEQTTKPVVLDPDRSGMPKKLSSANSGTASSGTDNRQNQKDDSIQLFKSYLLKTFYSNFKQWSTIGSGKASDLDDFQCKWKVLLSLKLHMLYYHLSNQTLIIHQLIALNNGWDVVDAEMIDKAFYNHRSSNRKQFEDEKKCLENDDFFDNLIRETCEKYMNNKIGHLKLLLTRLVASMNADSAFDSIVVDEIISTYKENDIIKFFYIAFRPKLKQIVNERSKQLLREQAAAE